MSDFSIRDLLDLQETLYAAECWKRSVKLCSADGLESMYDRDLVRIEELKQKIKEMINVGID